jgi:hypothetical protein
MSEQYQDLEHQARELADGHRGDHRPAVPGRLVRDAVGMPPVPPPLPDLPGEDEHEVTR